jgi:hypothetical protein
MVSRLRRFLDEEMSVPDWRSPPGVVGCMIKVRRIERMAELISVNGDLQVRQVDVVESGGMYGRRGLTADEGVELSSIGGFIAGVEMMDAVSEAEIRQEIRGIFSRRKHEIAAEQARATAAGISPS